MSFLNKYLKYKYKYLKLKGNGDERKEIIGTVSIFQLPQSEFTKYGTNLKISQIFKEFKNDLFLKYSQNIDVYFNVVNKSDITIDEVIAYKIKQYISNYFLDYIKFGLSPYLSTYEGTLPSYTKNNELDYSNFVKIWLSEPMKITMPLKQTYCTFVIAVQYSNHGNRIFVYIYDELNKGDTVHCKMTTSEIEEYINMALPTMKSKFPELNELFEKNMFIHNLAYSESDIY